MSDTIQSAAKFVAKWVPPAYQSEAIELLAQEFSTFHREGRAEATGTIASLRAALAGKEREAEGYRGALERHALRLHETHNFKALTPIYKCGFGVCREALAFLLPPALAAPKPPSSPSEPSGIAGQGGGGFPCGHPLGECNCDPYAGEMGPDACGTFKDIPNAPCFCSTHATDGKRLKGFRVHLKDGCYLTIEMWKARRGDSAQAHVYAKEHPEEVGGEKPQGGEGFKVCGIPADPGVPRGKVCGLARYHDGDHFFGLTLSRPTPSPSPGEVERAAGELAEATILAQETFDAHDVEGNRRAFLAIDRATEAYRRAKSAEGGE